MMAANFKIVRQRLIISRVHFEKRLVVGLVELHLLPLTPDVLTLRLNCRQSRIFEVLVNEVIPADYDYCDPTIKIVSDDRSLRNLDTFQNNQREALDSVDADKRRGELTIYLPKEVEGDINNGRQFRVSVEFALLAPAGGLHFVLPVMDDGSLLKNAMHMFTYGTPNSSRLWFPCVDSCNELCTWKMEITVDAMMTAVAPGELIEAVVSADGKEKTYFYELDVPTSACNIALAIGPFECYVDSSRNEVKHYCLPHLMPILKCTTETLHEAFEFYEEMLSVRYPYPAYKQVFVDEAYVNSQTFASMTIFNTNLLHSARIIDQNPLSRFAQAHGIAQQFFGCFISRKTWTDAWLTVGISKYLAYQYQKATFGNNEYRYAVRQMLSDVWEYEQNEAPIVLDSSNSKSSAYFDITIPQTLPSNYLDAFTKKSCLVLRMLENRLGKELLLQVFNKMLSLASLSANPEMWDNIMISTKSFIQSVFTVTGKDLEVFIDQWVYQSGCAYFNGNFVFNRKRNVVELELKQDMSGKGVHKYVGPLTVTIQELDGSFNHTFKIEENKTKFEITCHSKSRRQKKKKIPLMTGEEIDIDLTAMDADSPVLWLRIDPDMQVLRKVQWEQPDFMWQYQLRHERDVVAQAEALDMLSSFPTAATRQTLMDIIDDDHCFYRVRMSGAHCLVTVANEMASTWAGPPAMMNMFKKKFGSYSAPDIVRQLRFKNFQLYYLQRAIPLAMASLRNTHSICPSEVLKFIFDLFKYSDNSRNKYSDCYYTASLVEAATNTITPAIILASAGSMDHQTLSNESKVLLEEITRLLNLEKLLPSYRNVITISCLRCLRVLQQNGHLPSTPTFFKSYAQYGMFIDIRLAALTIISEFLNEGAAQKPQLDYLLDMASSDPVPRVRLHIMSDLVKQCAAITSLATDADNYEINCRLWRLMNLFCGQDALLCAEVVELYYKLYGRRSLTYVPREQSYIGHQEGVLSQMSEGVEAETIYDDTGQDQFGMADYSYQDTAENKSRLKKKKKKNKHKHKHKSERKEREEGMRQPTLSHIPVGLPILDTMAQLSEPSSPEMDDI
ncbi:transcription initiation factor TFIID subunit 2-like [Watersipora subatra]|uniref:transcription initiation factor TFIID subunit 2-like n=1 Tax=Watersipora subatra TaxID=2589382 RepID=UPI00355BE5B9